jgi:AraC-like DNA-binding protein
MVWLFVKGLDQRRSLSSDALHLLPAAIALAYFTPYLLQSGAAKIALLEQTTRIPLDQTFLGVAKGASVIGYMAAAHVRLSRMLAKHDIRLARDLARVLTVFLFFIVLVFAAFAAEHIVGELPVSSDALAAVGSAIFFYAVSMVVVADWREVASSGQISAHTTEAPAAASQRERVELLDRASSASLYKEVLAAVSGKSLYRRSGMKIDQLAEHVGLPAHYLSFVINAEAGKNYQSWLNALRVEHAKQALATERDKTVVEIGLSAGFNSKASFNRAFRAETGLSPSEYRASQIAN